jgi:GNAT superfamily N-acetyltransferase
MGSFEGVLIEEGMTPADAEAALPLSAEAGWNQTAEDWRFMLREGRGVGVRDASGRWIGSSLALPLGEDLSWISMVLVAKDQRRRGIGTRLLRRCVEAVQRAERAASLDATEFGRSVYLALGFRDLYPISRLWLEIPVRAEPLPTGHQIRPLIAADLVTVVAFDASRSAMERGHVLDYLFWQAPSSAFVVEVEERIVGYILGRAGRAAFQIGPVVADDENVARALVANALARANLPVIFDMPDAQPGLRRWLEGAGAVRQRGFTRMTLGKPPRGLADTSRIFALAGPELG